jgi:hypothetical protein
MRAEQTTTITEIILGRQASEGSCDRAKWSDRRRRHVPAVGGQLQYPAVTFFVGRVPIVVYPGKPRDQKCYFASTKE